MVTDWLDEFLFRLQNKTKRMIIKIGAIIKFIDKIILMNLVREEFIKLLENSKEENILFYSTLYFKTA